MKENNSQSTKAPLTSAERILAVLFGVGFILGILLSPLGVEPRMPELRTLAFAGFFIIVGMLLPLIGLVSVWLRRPRLAGVLAVIDAGYYSSSPHPPTRPCSSSQLPLHLLLPSVSTF